MVSLHCFVTSGVYIMVEELMSHLVATFLVLNGYGGMPSMYMSNYTIASTQRVLLIMYSCT